MSEPRYSADHSEEMVSNNLTGQDDIAAVLVVLRGLAEKTCHPIVRACLEQVCDDIVHLTSHGDEPREDDDFDAENSA